MKHRILKFSLITVAFAGLFQLSSCVRERDTDVSVAEQQVMGEFIYSNALEIADDAATKQAKIYLILKQVGIVPLLLMTK